MTTATLEDRSARSTDSARINLRTSPEAKALIERAAALMGTTVSGFMLQNAYEAAQRVVNDNDTIMLSQRDFEAFIAACETPSEPTQALRDLMARR
ncbi:MAG: DUF1778 domain-containing protein [Rhodocyclaceae bacterium]|nr:DUF1778 domain-containing protein [Rhodocyclaceae bacterium]MDZ4213810.1 DUF1778 domain-containing protein [Rhodocyclaceae bacterium]